MKFVNFDFAKAQELPGVTFFSEKKYHGEEQFVGKGSFNVNQILIPTVKSLRLSEGAMINCFEFMEKTGESVELLSDCPDIMDTLGFTPNCYTVSLYAKGLSAGNEKILSPGVYSTIDLYEFESIVVPKGLCLAIFGNQTNNSSIQMYSGENATIDNKISDFTRAIIFYPKKSDFSPQLLEDASTSYDDIFSALGGNIPERK